MAILYFLILFVLQLIPVTASTEPALPHGSVNDISFSNFILHEGYLLLGTPLKKVDVESFFDCLIECTANTRCLSANVNTTSDAQGLLECVLLGIDKYQPQSNLSKVEGIDHYALPDPCNCSNAGTCVKSTSRFLCMCVPGYKGGNCQSNYRDCSEIRAAGIINDGVYTIDPDGGGKFSVLCDMTTDGGGWTVFFKRFDFTVSFNRTWEAYKNGFGNISHGEFWLGNDNIHRLTAAKVSTLRVDLEDTNGLKTFAKYSTFQISAESEFYRLSVDGFSGTAGDGLDYEKKTNSTWNSNGMKFSTPDKDNDLCSCHCAAGSGWWYRWCAAAVLTTPNDMTWRTLAHIYIKKASMKLRPKDP